MKEAVRGENKKEMMKTLNSRLERNNMSSGMGTPLSLKKRKVLSRISPMGFPKY